MDNELNIKVKSKAEVSQMAILRKALNDATNEFLKLQKTGKATGDEIKNAGNKISQASQNLNTARQQVKEFTSSLQPSGFQLLQIGANATLLAQGIRGVIHEAVELGKKLFEAAHEGADFEILYENFVNLNGGVEQANANLALFRKASGGHLNNEELIKYSNTMSSLGYSTETTTKLLDIQHSISHLTGASFEQAGIALNKFITNGQGRGLPLIGENIAAIHAEMEKLSGKTIKEIGAMDELDQQTLRTNAVVALYGHTIEDITHKEQNNVDKIASLQTYYENLKSLVGVGVANAFVTLTGSITSSTEAMQYNIDKIAFYGQQVGKVLNDIADVINIKGFQSGDNIGANILGGILQTGENVKKTFDDANKTFEESQKEKPTGPSKEEFELQKRLQEQKDLPSTEKTPGSKGGGRTTTKQVTEELTFLAKALSDLAVIQARIAKQSESENIVEGLFGKQAGLENTIDFINFLEAHKDTLSFKNIQPGTVEGVVPKAIPLEDTFLSEIEADNRKKKEAKDAEDKFNARLSSALSLASTISSILNLGANTFINKLLKGLQDAISLADSIAKFLSLFLNVGSGGIFGFISGLFGGGGASPGRSLPVTHNLPVQRLIQEVHYIPVTTLRGDDIVLSYDNSKSKIIKKLIRTAA